MTSRNPWASAACRECTMRLRAEVYAKPQDLCVWLSQGQWRLKLYMVASRIRTGTSEQHLARPAGEAKQFLHMAEVFAVRSASTSMLGAGGVRGQATVCHGRACVGCKLRHKPDTVLACNPCSSCLHRRPWRARAYNALRCSQRQSAVPHWTLHQRAALAAHLVSRCFLSTLFTMYR